MLQVVNHRGGTPFPAGDEDFLATLAGSVAVAIDNAQMYAAIKRRYDVVVDEFHQWFEHYCTYPTHPDG